MSMVTNGWIVRDSAEQRLIEVNNNLVLIFSHILVLHECWVLTESRILLKPGLEGVRIVVLSISSHEQTQ